MPENPYETPKTKRPLKKKARNQRSLWIVRSLFIVLCIAIIFSPRPELEGPSKSAQIIMALIFYFIVTSLMRIRKR